MKLYLSSYRLGNHSDRLIDMAGGRGARMAVITNALDYIPPDVQNEYARTTFNPIAYFQDNGFDPFPLDLRDYFNAWDALRDTLKQCQVVFALGGNTFLLRHAMRNSGFDALTEYLQNENIVYAGWSAGACVAGTSLRAIAVMDDAAATASGYGDSAPIWEGLGLVPFSIIPHHQSNHPEAPLADEAVSFAEDQDIEYIALKDGEVLIFNGDKIEKLSRVSE